MANPIIQQIQSRYNGTEARRFIADLRKMREEMRLTQEAGKKGFGGGGSGGSGARTRATTAEAKALKDLRETTALARIEFDKLNQANRRGEISNEQFHKSVTELRQRVTPDLVAIRNQLESVPRAVEVQFGRAMVTLDRFGTRAHEVATGQTRLRTRITQGIQDALGLQVARLPGASLLMGAGIGGAAMTSAGVGLGAAVAIAKATAAAIKYEDALREVRKTTGLSAEDTVRLGDALLDSSAKLGMSEIKLAGIAAAAGQLGVRGQANIIAFTESVARLSAVSDLTEEEAAQSIGKIANAFEIPIRESERLGSVINELSNTTAASSAEIVDALSRVGPSALNLGLSVDQVAAMAATMIEVGIESRRAGTQLRNVFGIIQSEAARAAEVMGITEEQFRAMLSEDAFDAINQYLEALGKLPPQLQAIEIEKVFGRENAIGVQALVNGFKEAEDGVSRLAKNVEDAARAWREGTSLTTEYAIALDSASGQWAIFRQRMGAAATAAGQPFANLVKVGLRAINDLAGGAREAAGQIQVLRNELKDSEAAGKLLAKYEELTEKGLRRTAEETAELSKVTAQLAERFPEYVTAYDGLGRAVGIYADEVKRAREEEERLMRLQLADRQRELGKAIGETAARLDKLREAEETAIETGWARDAFGRAAQGRFAGTAGLADSPTFVSPDLALHRVRQGAAEASADMAELAGEVARLFDPATVSGNELSEALGITTEQAAQLVLRLREIASAKGDALRTDTEEEGGTTPLQNELERMRRAEEARQRASEALRKITEAQRIAAAFTKEEAAALQRVFAAQGRITELRELQKTLGEEAVRAQLEVAEAELRAAQKALEHADKFRTAVREAAIAIELAAGAAGRYLNPKGFEGPLDPVLNRKPQKPEPLIQDGFITPAALRGADDLKRKIEALEEAIQDSASSSEEFAGVLAGLGAAVTGIARLVDVFGDLSEELRGVLAGATDALRGMEGIMELRRKFGSAAGIGNPFEASATQVSGAAALGQIGAIVGLVTGAVSIARSLSNLGEEQKKRSAEERRRQEEMIRHLKELSRALEASRKAFQDAVDAVIGSGIVGGGVTPEDLAKGRGIVSRIEQEINRERGTEPSPRDPESRGDRGPRGETGRGRTGGRGRDTEGRTRGGVPVDDRADFFRNLAEEFDLLEIFDFDVSEFFDQLIEKYGGDIDKAIHELLTGEVAPGFEATRQGFQGLSSAMDDLEASFGEYSNSLAGAIQAHSDWIRFFGQDAVTAGQNFIGFLLENVEGLSEEAQKLLTEARSLDLSTPEGQERLQQIIQAIVTGGASLLGAGFTDRDARDLADVLQDALEAARNQAPEEERPFTSTTTNLRQFTEAQGAELVFIAIAQLGVLEDIRDALTGRTGFQMDPRLSQTLASVQSPPSPLPASVTGGSVVNSFGDVIINAPWTDREAMIRQLASDFERELRRRLPG